jgi:hypothetical protein
VVIAVQHEFGLPAEVAADPPDDQARGDAALYMERDI